MRKCISLLFSIFFIFSCISFNVNAINENEFVPYVVSFNISSELDDTVTGDSSRATGLINSYSLYLTKTGTTLNITGQTYGSIEVVKAGFKDLTIQRRKTSDDDWEDYYEYGNVYADAFAANLNTTLVVAAGYQYRISCKHYAKKNLLSVQTIANTSNIVTAKAT